MMDTSGGGSFGRVSYPQTTELAVLLGTCLSVLIQDTESPGNSTLNGHCPQQQFQLGSIKYYKKHFSMTTSELFFCSLTQRRFFEKDHIIEFDI